MIQYSMEASSRSGSAVSFRHISTVWARACTAIPARTMVPLFPDRSREASASAITTAASAPRNADAVTAAVPVDEDAVLSIIKAINPVNVVENEPFTYTFTIQNSSTTPAVATDNVTVTDRFDPIINIQSVTLNGVPLAEGTGYTYNEATGFFATVPSVITVPAATVVQDMATGAWIVTPGTAVLTVTGVI